MIELHTNKVYITKDLISDNDLSMLSVSGNHNIKINYLDYEIDLNLKLTKFL